LFFHTISYVAFYFAALMCEPFVERKDRRTQQAAWEHLRDVRQDTGNRDRVDTDTIESVRRG
jgi:hypothetical protein